MFRPQQAHQKRDSARGTARSADRRRLRRRQPTFEGLESRKLLTIAISAEEQLFLELLNRTRANPEAEVRRNPAVSTLNQDVAEDRLISSDPKQPLAPHQALADAMVGHLEDMLRRDYFGHDSPEGETPSERAIAAGYPVGAGENISWSGNTRGIDRKQEVYDRHAGLFESVGHRVNMMRPNWREVGPGVRYGIYTRDGTHYQSIMAGTLFGDRGGDHFLTGVVISDIIEANNFYEIGEGIGNARIRAVNVESGETFEVRTGTAGGYSIQVPDGVYDVTATGDRISRPLVVRAVQVDGENVKVDFNTNRMDTRYLQGRIFEDANGNRTRDTGDQVLPDILVFADLNENGERDGVEPFVSTDSTGLFRIESLLPDRYVLRVELPDGYQSTTGNGYQIDASLQNIVGIDFGLQAINLQPVAANDQATGLPGQEIAISVLANDQDPEGRLDRSTLQVVALPSHGSASVRGQSIVYRSETGFSGNDTFAYIVRDNEGLISNIAAVTVDVGSAWQNRNDALDVDDDGFIAPRDVLALVLDVNANGARYLHDTPRSTGDLYLDVNGDGFLSPIDVLRVVLHLNSLTSGSGEPPDVEATTTPIASRTNQIAVQDAYFQSLAESEGDEEEE